MGNSLISRLFKTKQQRTSDDINKLIKGTFNNELGQRLLEHLANTFIDRPMYKPGMSIEEVAFRQGEASVIEKLIKEVHKHG